MAKLEPTEVGAFESGRVAADAQAQGGQSHHVAAVGGQLADLLLVDQGADDV